MYATTAARDTVPSARPVLADDTASDSNAHGTCWGAIFAGAAAAAALSLILLMLGVGLGLSSVSPWTAEGLSATTLGVSTIAWITVTQLLASGMGGYLAGRLRSRWVAVHGDEVHFRDTAHGFLAWAIASLATAALLASVLGSIVSGGVQAGASAAGAVAVAGAAAASTQVTGRDGSDAIPVAYFTDTLFRKDASASAAAGTAAAAPAGETGGASPGVAPSPEAGRIFTANLQSTTLPPEDVRYVGQLVAQQTGLSQADAEKRVQDTYARLQAKMQQLKASAAETADTARKASATVTLWLFISLLIGAFCASLAATYGGRQRDR